ncbi:ABC transporter permease [Micromonospora zhanjiangensis]|uniref:ABC transporter permease n=1 Tax=Micromonospora zhanjiangensis TaxID=1522057 RepID=A0ABV8KM43_9ACTN
MTSTAYSAAIGRRGLLRKSLDTCAAYVRIDLVEERMFPATTVLRYAAVVFPVLLYFFQGSFLDTRDAFVFMLIGASVTAGFQDALSALTNRLQFAQERGTLETYLVEPVPWALIPVAMNIWRSVTGTLMACFMMGFGCLLGARIEWRAIPLALLVFLVGIAACNAIGTLTASFIILFKRGEPLIMLYSLAASVLGGTLFPVDVLPGWIRWLSYLVPHYYVIATERQLLMADPPAGGTSPGASIATLVVFCALVFAVGLFVFDRSLKLARKLGILSI